MSDLFDGANQAKNDQINGINAGLTAATGQINQGSSALTSNYTSGLAPFLNNYAQAQGGVGQLQNLLGLNGASGSNSAMQTLQGTPGYQFALGQGNNAVNAAAAANGTLNSGNQALALQHFGSGLADQTYQSAVSNLMPFLSSSNSSAAGIGGLYSGLGTQLNANSGTLANLNNNAQLGIANAQASSALANQSMDMSLLGGGLNLFSSLGGFGGLGGMFGGGSGGSSLFSDERLKEDIEPVGELYDGTNVYRYRYKGDGTPRIGVMAQEIEEKYPDAVTEIGGFKAVNYERATDLASALGKFLEAA